MNNELLSLLGTVWSKYYSSPAACELLSRINTDLFEQLKYDINVLSRSVQLEDSIVERRVSNYRLELDSKDFVGLSVPKPTGLSSLPVLMNRITNPSLIWQENVDFVVGKNTISFRANPFLCDLIPTMDGRCVLWGVATVVNANLMAAGQQNTCDDVRIAIRIADIQRHGLNTQRLNRLLAAMLKVPITGCEPERVEKIDGDRRSDVVITDKAVYRVLSAPLKLTSGSVLEPFSLLSDDFEVSSSPNCPKSGHGPHEIVITVRSGTLNLDILRQVIPPWIRITVQYAV